MLVFLSDNELGVFFQIHEGLKRRIRIVRNGILPYLIDLQNNNNREWYHSHKADFQKANQDFEDLIEGLIFEIGKVDSSILGHLPKELTFKLVRDTRFSHDKSPYNPAFRCHISSAGKMPVPVGYYLAIRPGNHSFLGGGLFADMFKDATNMIREYISTHTEEFEDITSDPAFAQNFEVKGVSLKKVPKKYPADHPMAKYLKYKSWYIEYPVDDSLIENTQSFIGYAAEKFSLMKPFNDFLNRALDGFVMPSR